MVLVLGPASSEGDCLLLKVFHLQTEVQKAVRQVFFKHKLLIRNMLDIEASKNVRISHNLVIEIWKKNCCCQLLNLWAKGNM